MAGRFEAAAWLFLQRVPAPVVVAAVKACDASWWTYAGQAALLGQVLRCAAAQLYPLPDDYVRMVAKLIADEAEQRGAATDAQEDWELHEELVMLLAGQRANGQRTTEESYHKTYCMPLSAAAGAPVLCMPTRVGPQFKNVGLSMWPSAFSLVLMLREELCGRGDLHLFSKDSPLGPCDGGVRILELGSGVGLTGCLLVALAKTVREGGSEMENTVPHFASIAMTAMTDYQQEVLNNCRYNVNACDATPHSSNFVSFAQLDWTEHDTNATWLRQQQFDLILGADVTYDASANPALARTIATALKTAREPSRALCIVFSTHRNDVTAGVFAQSLAEEGCVMDTTSVEGHVDPRLAHIETAVLDAAAELKGTNASAKLVGPFWVEMPTLLRRHVITLDHHTLEVV
jgi:predicted nicotinamide N-methyase